MNAQPSADNSNHPVLKARTACEPLETYVQAYPNKIATDFNGKSQTYGDFYDDVKRVGAGLINEGIAPQRRVAYIGLNADLYLQLLFGCALTGRLLVPINWRLAAPEIAYILKDCEAELVFVDPEFLKLVESVKDDCPDLKTIKLIHSNDGPGNTSAYETFETWRDKQPIDQAVTYAPKPDDVLVQMYTSGTTGFPKGALLTHQSMLAAISKGRLLNEDWCTWSETDVSLMAMPCFHIGGTIWGFQTLSNGGTCVVLDKPDIEQIITTITGKGITKMFAVPAVLLTILNHPLSEGADFTSMRGVFYGASPIPPATLRRALEAFQCNFTQYYGMTETSGSITYLPPQDHDVKGTPRMASCGKPFPNIEIKVVGDDGKDVPTGTVGEIMIHADSIMKGYWNRPEDTADAFVGKWYKSGDAGYLDEDGYVYLFDRVKDMIVSGAENIYPAEVEGALMEHPAIADAAVIGVPDDKWGEAVKAIVVKRSDVSEADVIAFTKTRIAGFKAPKSVDFVDALPRNPTGKILKKELRKPYWPEDGRRVG